MAVLIGFLLVLFCIGVILYPFLKSRSRSATPDSLEELAHRRRAIYAEIETLKLERELGNLVEEEYQRALQSHRLAAAATFREQEALEVRLEEADRVLEQEVLRLRGRRLHQGWATSSPNSAPLDEEEEGGP